MDGRCKSCKHWRRGGAFTSHRPGYGASTSFETIGAGVFITTDPKALFGICLHPSVVSDYTSSWLKRKIRHNEPQDGVHAICDEERGDLAVGQDFGCIHHEPCTS